MVSVDEIPLLLAEPRGRKSQPPPVTCTMRTDALLRGLEAVIENHGASPSVRQALRLQVHEYLAPCQEHEMVWLKSVKHMIAYPLAKYLRNEVPEAPTGGRFRPRGELQNWLKPRMKVFNPKNTHLWFSWFQAKRACLQVSDNVVVENYRAHAAMLKSDDPGVDETISAILREPTFRRTLAGLRNTFMKMMRRARGWKEYLPSRNACLESSRGRGGALGHLRGLVAGIDDDSAPLLDFENWVREGTQTLLEAPGMKCRRYDEAFSDGRIHAYLPAPEGMSDEYAAELAVQQSFCGRIPFRVTPPCDRDLISARWSPRILQPSGRFSSGVIWSYADPDPGWDSLPKFVPKVDTWPSLPVSDENPEGVVGGSRTRPLGAKIQAVLEPCKVRIISKGPALPYYSAKRIQKSLFKAIRTIPALRLAGKTFCPTQLYAAHMNAKPDDLWFSVDYSAATDGLSWKYSKSILDVVLSECSEEDRALALNVLGPHEIAYPKVWNGTNFAVPKGLEPYVQRNGQLMGSVLSFPFLCLANLGVYLLNTSLLHQERGWSDGTRLESVLVNGDDMLYAAPKSLWRTHSQIASEVGLKMSVGKSYVHHTYANVNSTSVHFDLRRADASPNQIGYINVGLLFGQSKVLQEEGKAGTTVSATINTLLDGCRESQKIDVLKTFLRVNAETLKKETECVLLKKGKTFGHTRNLFLPQSSGGMGVVPPLDWKFRVTKNDRWLAGALEPIYALDFSRPTPNVNDLRISVVVRGCPIPGYTLPPPDPPRVQAPWCVPAPSVRKVEFNIPPRQTCLSRRAAVQGRVVYTTIPADAVAARGPAPGTSS